MLTKIVCLGNELVCDDGIGIRVGRVLGALALGPEVAVEFRPHLSLDLLDIIEVSERLILIDAMSTGNAAGTCVVLHGAQLEQWSSKAVLAHGLSIAQVMELAKRLFGERALASVYFVGIEGRSFDGYGTTLCPEVRAALPNAVESVLRIIGVDEPLIAKARRQSERAARSDPTISEILLLQP